MSIILNALRKSEQERQIRQPESLENRVLAKQGVVQKKIPVWLIVLVIINTFFLIFFFWSYTKDDINEDKAGKTVVVEKLEIKDKEKVKTSLSPDVVKPTTKVQISIAEQLKENQASKDKKDIEKPEHLIEKLVRNDIKEKPEPEQKTIQRGELQKKPVFTTAVVEEPLFDRVTKNNSSEVQQENDPPFLSELDYDFRRTVPEIDINVFVYSENEADRFIMVNMKKYLSGQQLDTGMNLKEIRINSIVVEFKNKVFQIKRK